MLRLKRFWLIAALILLLVPGLALAKQIKKNITVPADEIVNDNFIGFGETIVVKGTVEGDAVLFGSSVTIEEGAVIKGDLLTAAATIDMSGAVEGNMRAAGSTVTIDGTVGKNASIAASTFHLNDGAAIGWSAQIAASTAQIDGTVSGQANTYTSTTEIAGAVGGNLQSTTSSLTVTSAATVGGNVTYRSDNDADISSNASIGGTVLKKDPTVTKEGWTRFGRQLGLFFWFVKTTGMVIIGFVLVLAWPRSAGAILTSMRTNPWKHLLIGLVLLIVTPIAAVLLMATVVGIPLALLLLVVWGVLLCLSSIFAGWMLGHWLLTSWKATAGWPAAAMMLVGVVIYEVITTVPFFGWLIGLIGMVWGLSALTMALFKPQMVEKK